MTATVTALLLALAPAVAPGAAHSVDPTEVKAEEVHAFLVGTPKAVVVDARSDQEFEQAHIPGAISIPAERTKAEAAKLPRDRGTMLVFYCRGPG